MDTATQIPNFGAFYIVVEWSKKQNKCIWVKCLHISLYKSYIYPEGTKQMEENLNFHVPADPRTGHFVMGLPERCSSGVMHMVLPKM